jgi:putative tryptophan/tyrosine transport system substrate-binding protein
MHRRDIVRLGLLAGASLSANARLRAQQSPVRIGALVPVPDNGRFSASLRDGLRDLSWIEGSAFTLQIRQADGTVAAFRRLGAELVALPVDVLVTASTAAATALAQTTTTIPIVFVGTFDPIAAGLVDSLDHPGRNLTGIAGFQAGIAARWVSQLKEIAPGVTEMVIFSIRARSRRLRSLDGRLSRRRARSSARSVLTPSQTSIRRSPMWRRTRTRA